MNGFDFISAADLKDALAILAREKGNACLVAGATNVTVKARTCRIKDKLLVSIDKLDELRGIREEDGYIFIGAMTDMNTIAKSQLIKEKGYVLWEAAQVFGDPVIRNRATIGGNIADASPTADSGPPLLVLKAAVVLRSACGERVVPLDQFFISVGRTVLLPDEIITAIRFKPNDKGAFIKIGLRNAAAKTVVSAAATVKLDVEGKVADCAIALGSVAPKPVRAYNAEKVLLGKKLTDDMLSEMKEAVKMDISPIESIRATVSYRLGVSATIVERAVKRAL